jgi:hypothetical protein
VADLAAENARLRRSRERLRATLREIARQTWRECRNAHKVCTGNRETGESAEDALTRDTEAFRRA